MRIPIVLAAALFAAGLAAAQDQRQVNVSVKIVEFQTIRGVETGLSAYFQRRTEPRPYGRVSSGRGNVTSADFTFPTSTTAGITVFLDRLRGRYGDFEVILQGLVDQNRAFILSRPKAMVPVGPLADDGSPTLPPTVIQTTQQIPYENTVVVGATAVQTTSFRDTGVMLNVNALDVINDGPDGETYIKLRLRAEVKEEGQRITVALDDSISANQGGIIGGGRSNAISVPEFVSRSLETTVWVRHGEVLILGGLYRNTKNKDLATLPWLTQTEDVVMGALQAALPFSAPSVPVSAGLGQRSVSEGRRELVFLIRAEEWRPAYTVASDFGFDEDDAARAERGRLSPADVITGVLEGLTDIPLGIVEGFSSSDGVSSSLGAEKE